MLSNSKLDKIQKSDLKTLRDMFMHDGGELFSFPERGVTIAVMPALRGAECNTSRVATAVCSPNEQKFRRKVGEYVALKNMYDSKYIAVPVVVFAHDFANEFANLFYN